MKRNGFDSIYLKLRNIKFINATSFWSILPSVQLYARERKMTVLHRCYLPFYTLFPFFSTFFWFDAVQFYGTHPWDALPLPSFWILIGGNKKKRLEGWRWEKDLGLNSVFSGLWVGNGWVLLLRATAPGSWALSLNRASSQ